MFTGIVEELGTVSAARPDATGARIHIAATRVLEDTQVGASIAVNGCCLTVVDRGDGWWAADVVKETLHRTCLGNLRPGDRVNLERPLRLDGRLGGHLVLGHVDDTATIIEREPSQDGSILTRVRVAKQLMAYVAQKGSVAIDGVSLTVVDQSECGFSVVLIPHTQSVTTLGIKKVGDQVNLEVDVLAKYLERLHQATIPCD